MNILAIDTENNTWNKGAPFDRRFKNVCYSWADSSGSGAVKTSPDTLAELGERIRRADLLVGFNLKYDLHVLRKLGVEFGDKAVWDCQLGEFILSRQQWKYPDLATSCTNYGLPMKTGDEVSTYWNNGVQTEDIPWETLSSYAENDAVITLKLYEHQQKIMTPAQKRLARLQNMDLLILEEMEWNGLRYDHELCEQRAEEVTNEIQQITDQLSGIYPDVPINFNSGDDLSSFLYGGTVVEIRKEHIGFFKSGAKAGEPRYRNVEVPHQLPRLVTPLPRSELKKEGYYAVNKDTLLKLKPSKKTKAIIELIQQQVRYDTLLSKTYNGIRKANAEGNWERGWIHGQFNQCTVATGRLSSSNPNMQNIDGEALDLFISRYP